MAEVTLHKIIKRYDDAEVIHCVDPFRSEIAKTASIARGMPAGTQFQFGIQDIINEELQATYLTGKAQALADMERRVNDILARSR